DPVANHFAFVAGQCMQKFPGGHVPQAHFAVLARRSQHLAVWRKCHGLWELPTGQRVPQLAALYFPNADLTVASRRCQQLAVVGDTEKLAAFVMSLELTELLAGSHVVQTDNGMLNADDQPVAARQKTEPWQASAAVSRKDVQ